jgi:hypothetical protein
MKTKILYRFAMATAIAGTVFVACSKSSSTADNGTSSADLQTQSSDQTSISNETDAVADDANVAMSSQSSISGAGSLQSTVQGQGRIIEGVQGVNSPLICDAAITVDSVANPRTITITYNGANCSATRTRTGVVVISIPAGTHWRDTGAVVAVSIQNLKITRLIDGKFITINGTHTYTNVSGGSLVGLYEGVVKSITHTITSSNMTITFDNNTQRSWSVARQRVITDTNQAVTITITGLHTNGATTGISEWGTNRFGNSFETVIVHPVIIQSGCAWRVTNGEVEVIRPEVTTTVAFGLDALGNPASCPVGTYYFEVVWSAANKSYTAILPY